MVKLSLEDKVSSEHTVTYRSLEDRPSTAKVWFEHLRNVCNAAGNLQKKILNLF